jgi:deoxyribodipyrimidine photo-lyase
MIKDIALFWFRRDLRLDDNCGLFKALSDKYPVLPIFIFDEDILEKLPKDDARVSFIHKQIENINTSLKINHSSLAIYYGQPLKVIEKLTKKYNVKSVFTNHDYEPYAIKRDQEIGAFLKSKNIHFKTFKDQVIFEQDEIVKQDSTPYRVFTPFSKKWIEAFKSKPEVFYPSEEKLDNFIKNQNLPFLSLNNIGFQESNIKVVDYQLNPKLIDEYEETRNFPSKDSTSKLGTQLRFGTVSIRKTVKLANNQKNDTFLKELIWREFFMQILWHFPHTVTQSFKPKYDFIQWKNDEKDFEKWCIGQTGYPLVDAGMRELNKTGFMHNRVRMLVGSFLCKHLLIDWRWGEAYFAEKLHDYELSSNIGNWQWVAGCGVDAAPYFRIFNPTTQIQKFDKELKYINKWVPEFQELTYTNPIIEHKFARERCLKTYKEALNNL